MQLGRKRLGAVLAVAVLIAAALFYLIQPAEEGAVEQATIDDLIASTSVRKGDVGEVVAVDQSSPFFAMMATPLAVYYDISGEKYTVPLLVMGNSPETQENGVSRSVKDFITASDRKNGVFIGRMPEDSGISPSVYIETQCPRVASREVARTFWERSDGAILVHASEEGYDAAVPIAPLASYLNIPVLVAKETSEVRDVLRDLQVKYVLVAGKLEGYRKTRRVEDVYEALNITALGVPSKDGTLRSVMQDRLGIVPEYITLANPLDAHEPEVLSSVTYVFNGTLKSKETGSTYRPDTSDPSHTFEIPEGADVNIIVDSYMTFTKNPDPRRNPDKDGQRSYTYIGVDKDSDGAIDRLEFFAPSLAYRNIHQGSTSVAAHAHMRHILYNASPVQTVQIAGTLHESFPENVPISLPGSVPETNYTI